MVIVTKYQGSPHIYWHDENLLFSFDGRIYHVGIGV